MYIGALQVAMMMMMMMMLCYFRYQQLARIVTAAHIHKYVTVNEDIFNN